MDVVLVSVDFFDDEFGSVLRQIFENFQEIRLDTSIQDLPPVFGRPHQVVVTRENKVAHPAVRGHSTY